ncbi:MAG: hypothetical protein ACLFM7_07110 [Bacteroidales bacterium]
MATSNVLSAAGSITKKEYVCTTRIRALKNYLILESVDPFPEAHIRHKSSFVKFYYAGIISDMLDQDIKIAAQSAEGQIRGEVASAVGELKIGDKAFNAIRLRNVSSQMLPRLIKAYEYEGIRMQPREENIHDYAWIHIRKFFHLEEIEEGIFTDLDDPYIGYLQLPKTVEWPELEALTGKVKTETHYPNFDRALGTIFKQGDPIEVIRIFSPDMTEEVLKDIAASYRKFFSDL